MELDAPSQPSVEWRSTLWVCLALALVTLLTYWPVTGYDFCGYDDTDYVTQNPYVQAGLSARSLAWVWHSEVARNWHPVTMLSHMLDCQWHGLKAGWHHFTNLLLHSANTALLFLLLRRLTGALWRSALVAALFALHPLHVESVAWVAERKDVLSTLFFLLTIWAYAEYVGRTGRRSPKAESRSPKEARNPKAEARKGRAGVVKPANKAAATEPRAPGRAGPLPFYVLALGLFALGLMSKPMLVTTPFVLLLLDYWPLRRLGSAGVGESPEVTGSSGVPRHKPGASAFRLSTLNAQPSTILDKLPFLALAAASSVVTFLVQQRGGAVRSTGVLPVAARVENALVSYVRYLDKMVWPEHLAALYLWPPGWAAWQVSLATLFLVAVTSAVIWQGRRRPYLAVGWFWYVGTLVPVIGLVQVGMQTMADRYTYIPLIGIFLMLVWGAWEWLGRWRMPRPATALMAAALLSACVVLTCAQLVYWQNGETLFKRMITATRGNYMAHYNLGNLYDRRGDSSQAILNYEAALRIEPNYADAHNNLGGVLLRQHRYDEALAHYQSAVRIAGDSPHLFNLANALADAGKLPEAIASYRQCLQMTPAFAPAHYNLGLVLQTQGKAAEAGTEFRAALALDPKYESAEYNLANLLAEAGQTGEAVAHYVNAERLNPQRAESYNGLGICYAIQGKMAEAEAQFRESLRLNPKNPGAESNLGNALGSQNRLAEAIPHYHKALEFSPNDYQTHFNLALSLLHQGQKVPAREHLQEALRLHPDYPEAQKALASLEAEGQKK